jgi:hypothetical protein
MNSFTPQKDTLFTALVLIAVLALYTLACVIIFQSDIPPEQSRILRFGIAIVLAIAAIVARHFRFRQLHKRSVEKK